jgi:hypothetical protein
MRRRQLYVYWRQMLANGNGLVCTDIGFSLAPKTARRAGAGRKEYPSCSSQRLPH